MNTAVLFRLELYRLFLTLVVRVNDTTLLSSIDSRKRIIEGQIYGQTIVFGENQTTGKIQRIREFEQPLGGRNIVLSFSLSLKREREMEGLLSLYKGNFLRSKGWVDKLICLGRIDEAKFDDYLCFPSEEWWHSICFIKCHYRRILMITITVLIRRSLRPKIGFGVDKRVFEYGQNLCC